MYFGFLFTFFCRWSFYFLKQSNKTYHFTWPFSLPVVPTFSQSVDAVGGSGSALALTINKLTSSDEWRNFAAQRELQSFSFAQYYVRILVKAPRSGGAPTGATASVYQLFNHSYASRPQCWICWLMFGREIKTRGHCSFT